MPEKTVALNRRARHEFTIEDTLEAGLVLTGTEIKSIRAGKVNLADAYARIERGEAWLVGAHIAPFEQANRYNHEPKRVAEAPPAPLRDRRAARQDEGEGPDARPAPAVPRRQGPGQDRAGPRPRQAAPRPAAGHRRSGRAARHGPRARRRPAGTVRAACRDGRRRPAPARALDPGGRPPRLRRARPGDRERGRGRPGRDDVRGDDLAAGEPRRPPAADAPRASRLPGRELQPRPAVVEPATRRPAT